MSGLTPMESRLLAAAVSRNALLQTHAELRAELRVAAKNHSGTHSAEVVEFAQRLLEIAEACDWKEKA